MYPHQILYIYIYKKKHAVINVQNNEIVAIYQFRFEIVELRPELIHNNVNMSAFLRNYYNKVLDDGERKSLRCIGSRTLPETYSENIKKNISSFRRRQTETCQDTQK